MSGIEAEERSPLSLEVGVSESYPRLCQDEIICWLLDNPASQVWSLEWTICTILRK